MGSHPDAAGPGAQNGRVREQVTGARRIVVKVGSSSLTTAAGGIDEQRVDTLVDALGDLAAQGREVVLVSSGAIAAGLAPLKLRRRPRDLATQQAAASVGQGLLIGRYAAGFARHGLTVGQILLTVDDVTRRAHYRNAYRTLRKLLDLGALPIVNENDTVATEEIRFGDNDRLAALVAALVQADLLVLLSDVDALYTGDPAAPGVPMSRAARSSGPRTSGTRVVPGRLGGPSYSASTSESRISTSAPTSSETSAASRSLSPNRISCVATVSFSLTMGIMRRSSRRSIARWALPRCVAFSRSPAVRSTWPATIL